jgi:hypothetical protein
LIRSLLLNANNQNAAQYRQVLRVHQVILLLI